MSGPGTKLSYEVICNYSNKELKALSSTDLKAVKEWAKTRIDGISKVIGTGTVYDETPTGKKLKEERIELRRLMQRLRFI